VWTPICWHWNVDEVRYVVRDSEARAFLAHVDFAEAALAACEGVPPEARFSVGGEIPGFRRFEEVAEFSDADLESPLAGGTLLYTSGTTGRPKGVWRPPGEDRPPPGTTGQAGRAMLERFTDDAARGPHLVAAPLYHAGPNTYCEGAVLLGADIVLLDHWDAEEFLRAVEQESICSTFLVPTHFVRLLRLEESRRRAFDTSSLRLAVHGAAPVAVAVKRRMIEWLGPVLFEFYGGTEGGGIGISSEDWLAHPGSVGKPNPGVEVMVLDEKGEPCPPDVQGDVYFRTQGNFEYKGDPEKTAEGRRGDCYTLGDVGYLDADGYLYLGDRRTDMILTGGQNVYPAEVEAALTEHPAVKSCCVIGLPDADLGNRVHALVELATPVSDDGLLAHLRERLVAWKLPREFERVDAPLRDDAGKARRGALRAVRLPRGGEE